MAQQEKSQANGKTKPVIVFRCGRIKAAVWANQHTRQSDGATVTTHSITLTKSFKEKDSEEWREFSMPLFPEELWQIQQVLESVKSQFCIRTET